MKKTEQQIRAEFEQSELDQYLSDGGVNSDYFKENMFQRFSSGRYKAESIENRWIGWSTCQHKNDIETQDCG